MVCCCEEVCQLCEALERADESASILSVTAWCLTQIVFSPRAGGLASGASLPRDLVSCVKLPDVEEADSSPLVTTS